MNCLHLFDVHVLFLHPSAFRYAHRPTLHRDPAHHPNFIWFSPLSIPAHSSPHFLPLRFFSERGMRVLSGDGHVEGWRGGEKHKSSRYSGRIGFNKCPEILFSEPKKGLIRTLVENICQFLSQKHANKLKSKKCKNQETAKANEPK